MSVWEKNLSVDEFELIWCGKRLYIKIGPTKYTDYKVADIVHLKEYDKNRKTVTKYTGRKISVRVLSVVKKVVKFSVIGLEQINIYQYVDSETFKKVKKENG